MTTANVVDFGTKVAQGNVTTMTGAFKVDTMRGANVGTVSSQWWSRPDDERYLSLDEMYADAKRQAEHSRAEIIDVSAIEVVPGNTQETIRDMTFKVHNSNLLDESTPTNWSFNQLCSLVKAPAAFLTDLPAPIAAVPLQYRIASYPSEKMKALVTENGHSELRAITGQDYGRVYDHTVIHSIQKIAGNGTGDTQWKCPGLLEENFTKYNPFVEVNKQTTTFYRSDRDFFVFLVDDTHPIEIGKLPNGDPDYVFRGFYVWNSEVGSKKFGVATMYLRGVCMNRNLWGVEGFQEIAFRHSKNAPDKFIETAMPALNRYANANTQRLIAGVKEAQKLIVAENDEKAVEFLLNQKFTRSQAANILKIGEQEEGHKPRSVWDFVQCITAMARSEQHQDERITIERRAGALLDKVKVA